MITILWTIFWLSSGIIVGFCLYWAYKKNFWINNKETITSVEQEIIEWKPENLDILAKSIIVELVPDKLFDEPEDYVKIAFDISEAFIEESKKRRK